MSIAVPLPCGLFTLKIAVSSICMLAYSLPKVTEYLYILVEGKQNLIF
jgi:hypothetical protein